MATVPTISPLRFALATAIASPKLLIHVFIGSRLAAINKSDPLGKAVNWASIIGGMILGAVTGWLIYSRTVARAKQLEREEAPKARARGLSHPDEFADEVDGGEAEMGAGHDDDIDFLEGEGEYRDEDGEAEEGIKYQNGDEENSIGLDARRMKR